MHEHRATIYVDVAALEPDVGAMADQAPQRGGLDHPALRHLDDLGHRVVLLDHGAAPGRDAEGWLVTRDPALCGRARACPLLRSMLVGPNVPGRGLAHRPSDVEARDLTTAVLTILAAEAMPVTRGEPSRIPESPEHASASRAPNGGGDVNAGADRVDRLQRHVPA